MGSLPHFRGALNPKASQPLGFVSRGAHKIQSFPCSPLEEQLKSNTKRAAWHISTTRVRFFGTPSPSPPVDPTASASRRARRASSSSRSSPNWRCRTCRISSPRMGRDHLEGEGGWGGNVKEMCLRCFGLRASFCTWCLQSSYFLHFAKLFEIAGKPTLTL